MAAAGFTRPPLVGTWVMAMSFTRSSSISWSAFTDTWPCASSGMTSTTAPVRCATWRNAMKLLAYSAFAVRMRSPFSKRRE
jgi:hypothetical protein